MESTTKTILLVPDEACAAEFRQALSSRYRSAVDGIDVYVAEGPLHEVLARARSRFGGAPLGYLAADETSALEALRHGADEAMATPLPSEQAIHGFVDRTVLRAVLRRATQVHDAAVRTLEAATHLGQTATKAEQHLLGGHRFDR
jgi:hypothetical protein